jgi:hypothetical protein
VCGRELLDAAKAASRLSVVGSFTSKQTHRAPRRAGALPRA